MKGLPDFLKPVSIFHLLDFGRYHMKNNILQYFKAYNLKISEIEEKKINEIINFFRSKYDIYLPLIIGPVFSLGYIPVIYLSNLDYNLPLSVYIALLLLLGISSIYLIGIEIDSEIIKTIYHVIRLEKIKLSAHWKGKVIYIYSLVNAVLILFSHYLIIFLYTNNIFGVIFKFKGFVLISTIAGFIYVAIKLAISISSWKKFEDRIINIY